MHRVLNRLGASALGLAACFACSPSHRPPLPKDLASNFFDCVKTEGNPTRSDHSAITKCLVERFGWPVVQADRGADSIVSAYFVSLDSAQHALEDSMLRAEQAKGKGAKKAHE